MMLEVQETMVLTRPTPDSKVAVWPDRCVLLLVKLKIWWDSGR